MGARFTSTLHLATRQDRTNCTHDAFFWQWYALKYVKNPAYSQFYVSDVLIWVQINACYSARNLDFADLCGSRNDDPVHAPIGKQVYIG